MKNPSRSIPLPTLAFAGAIFAAISAASGQTLAFPGAEGFGRFASGGRGGDVYIVTNLNDSGPGSLRAGVTGRNSGSPPRTVVFAVSGTIQLNSTLRITQGNLTIAGQSAPGDGICLANYPLDPSNASNVIIRFLRSRLGDLAGQETDAFNCRYAENMIIDHCSFTWAVDETATAYDNRNFTMQWCIIAESLRESLHDKGAHGYGGIWGGRGASFHHNLIAHHDSRLPRLNGARYHNEADELVDFRNNVIYNWRGNTTYGGEAAGTGSPAHHNLINNYYKPGPATGASSVRHRVLEPYANAEAPAGSQFSLFYIAGNHTAANATVSADNWNGGVQGISSSLFANIRSDAAFTVAPVITQPAIEAYPLVLDHAGSVRPVRDSVDARIVAETRNGTFTFRGSKGNLAGIIDTQGDVGGWPALASLPALPDADQDGMPDAWELARGLNPNDPADRNGLNPGGYTNLEIYLNELAAPAFPIPQITTQPQSLTVTAGAGFELSVAADSTGAATYQWFLGAEPVAGATASTLSVTATTLAQIGSYTVAVSNGYGSVVSDAATVTFDELVPTIATGPAPLALEEGQAAIFTVDATGTQPISYQWYRGTRLLPGANAATLDLGPAGFGHAGSYHVVVSNAHGAAVSSAATLAVTRIAGETIFSTGFTADTLHAASPVVSPTATNWYVMSSKDARSSSISSSRLDLTMPSTSSGVIEAAALFTTAPVTLATGGETLRLRVELETSNIRTLGMGLFDASGSLPHTGLINTQLLGSSSTLATGGTQTWKGVRLQLDTNSASLVHYARPEQPGTTNASQSLIVAGTSSSAPTSETLATTPAAGFTWADGSTYTLTLDIRRTGPTSHAVTTTIHAGTDLSAPPVVTGTADAGNFTRFSALALGLRNRDANTAPRLRIRQVTVQLVGEQTTVANPYEAFLLDHDLELSGAGAPGEDPDQDGVENALEFVLGGDPNAPDRVILPVLESGEDWTFRFLQHIDAGSAFDIVAEESTDLLDWEPMEHGTGGISILITPHDTTHDRIEIRVPGEASAPRFFRLSARTKP